jgi:hypothetical protein
LKTTGVRDNEFEDSLSTAIPSGYVFGNAYVEKADEAGNPTVEIENAPPAGASGVADFVLHIKLSGAILARKRDQVNYRVCVVAVPGPDMIAAWNTTVKTWRDEQAQKEIDTFLAGKQDALKGLDVSAWPPSELMRRAIAELFGDPSNYDSCDVVEMLHRVFEWENLTYRLYAPWFNPHTQVDGLQSLSTTFMNASMARLDVPLRPGYEEEAITFLASVGAIPAQQPLLDDIQYYLDDMRANVAPLYTRTYVPSEGDAKEVDGPCDLLLTTLGEDKWLHDYESQLKFQVLDRWVTLNPTDGVDYEEVLARCPLPEDADDAAPPSVETPPTPPVTPASPATAGSSATSGTGAVPRALGEPGLGAPVVPTSTFVVVPQPAAMISTIFTAKPSGPAEVFESKMYFSNPTPVPAFDLQVVDIAFKTTSGSGGVTMSGTLPLVFGDVPANGQSTILPVSYVIPDSVKTYDILVTVKLKNADGTLFTSQLSLPESRP